MHRFGGLRHGHFVEIILQFSLLGKKVGSFYLMKRMCLSLPACISYRALKETSTITNDVWGNLKQLWTTIQHI